MEKRKEVWSIFSIKNPIEVESLNCDSSVATFLGFRDVQIEVLCFSSSYKIIWTFETVYKSIFKFEKDFDETNKIVLDPVSLIIFVFLNFFYNPFLINQGGLTCENNFFSVILWPLYHKWHLEQRGIVLWLIKIIQCLDGNHAWEVT